MFGTIIPLVVASMAMVCVAWGAMFAWYLLMYRRADLPRDLATLLYRYLDRHLSWYLDTLSDWPVMAYLLWDRSCYCSAVCAGDSHTHWDRDTVWHGHLAGGFYRNFLALPFCVSLALWGLLMNGYWSRVDSMGSSNIEELSICISLSICFWISFGITLSNMMSTGMRQSMRSRGSKSCTSSMDTKRPSSMDTKRPSSMDTKRTRSMDTKRPRSMATKRPSSMDIYRAANHMTNNSTVCLSGDGCLCAVVSDDVLALLHIGGVHHSLVVSVALLLLVTLLLCVGGTLLLRHMLDHSVALWHRVSGTLLLSLSHIVSHVLSVTDSLWHGVTLLAGHDLIGHVTLGSIVTMSSTMGVWIAISTTMTIVTTIARVGICFGISRGFSFC